jgi:hypothetical protein
LSSSAEDSFARDASTPTPTPKRIPAKGGRGRRGSGSTTASEEADEKAPDSQASTPAGLGAPGFETPKTHASALAKDTPKSKLRYKFLCAQCENSFSFS